MYAYFMCSFACLGFGVSYPPTLSGYDTHDLAANSTAWLRCFAAASNQSICVCGGKSNTVTLRMTGDPPNTIELERF